MNGIKEKISRRKVLVSILLVSIVAFSAAYALFQTRTGFAVLTFPPPGILGPYYVTAEAKIYGPVVDLAMIKSKMSGTYASDYTYVQWGTNPFFRVYIDNTLQQVYYGSMMDIMQRFSNQFLIESYLKTTFNTLKSNGAIDPASEMGLSYYFGNMPGIFISIYRSAPYGWSGTLTTRNSRWYATVGWTGSQIEVRLNNTRCVYSGGSTVINASGSSANLYYWSISGQYSLGATLYFEDLLSIETTLTDEYLRVYTVIDSSGTAFVSKDVSPSSPMQGQTIDVTVRFDPPTASKMNITELYPNTFAWGGQQITLEKFRIGTGLVATTSVSASLTPVGPNMQFTIYYYQASGILESLLSDEYVYMRYSLNAPNTAGEYTLPAATMSYLIPTPQT